VREQHGGWRRLKTWKPFAKRAVPLAKRLHPLIADKACVTFIREIPSWNAFQDTGRVASVRPRSDNRGNNRIEVRRLLFPDASMEIWAGETGTPEPVCSHQLRWNEIAQPDTRISAGSSRGPSRYSFRRRLFVNFVSRDAEPDVVTRERVAALLTRVPALGPACSFVRLYVADRVNALNWILMGTEVTRCACSERADCIPWRDCSKSGDGPLSDLRNAIRKWESDLRRVAPSESHPALS